MGGEKMKRCMLLAIVLVFVCLSYGAAFGGTINVPWDYPTIQAAIDAASSGDIILVADGIWTGDGNKNLDATGKESLTIESANGPTSCIIDCEGSGNGVNTGWHVGLQIEGFTIRNCGSGIYLHASNEEGGLNVDNCIIRNNSGSGVVSNVASVSNCVIKNNGGYGIDTGFGYGTGMGVSNSIITGNAGGIVGLVSSIENSIIADNSPNGGVFLEGGYNSTIANNTTTESHGGGGLHRWGGPEITVVNSIIWGNSPNEMYLASGVTADITYSDIRGGFPGVGNIDEIPMFVDFTNHDYHLQQTVSPCIDAGTNSASLPATDFEGDGRVLDGDNDGTATVDMGADEHVYTPPKTLTSGQSQTGSVTQGHFVYYQIAASASDTQLLVELTNLSDDVDLIVKEGSIPTWSNYDCFPYEWGTTPETCTLPNSGATTWYMGVYGYHAGSYTITATLSGEGGDCQGYCGTQSPKGCWCDEQCVNYGDCCTSVCDDCPALSYCVVFCQGICGKQHIYGCWCDAECKTYNDCCPDYDQYCGALGEVMAGQSLQSVK